MTELYEDTLTELVALAESFVEIAHAKDTLRDSDRAKLAVHQLYALRTRALSAEIAPLVRCLSAINGHLMMGVRNNEDAKSGEHFKRARALTGGLIVALGG